MKAISKQIDALRKLGLSEEEIADVIKTDKAIDKGEKLFELTDEQEKASKQARKADRTPTVYKLDNEKGKRSKKEDKDKTALMEIIGNAIQPIAKSYELTKAGECVFNYNGRKFKIVLSAPRS